MKLPTISVPRYNLTIPSTGKKVTFRPFLVREEKVLMIAQESGESSAVLDAINSVIQTCTFDKIKPGDLTTFDIEWIFVKLRAKSVGEISTVSVNCQSCDEVIEVDINLDDVQLSEIKPLPEKVMLTDSIGVIPRYMRDSDTSTLMDIDEKNQGLMISAMLAANIEAIFDDENVYPLKDSTIEEFDEFVAGLTREQVDKCEGFIADVPGLFYDVEYTCPKCGKEHTDKIEGGQNFF